MRKNEGKAKEARENKLATLTQAPVESLVVRMAIPTILTMMVTAMYNAADTYFVSGIGTAPTAAVGVVFPLMNILQAIGYFFGHGAGTYISRELGAGKFDKAEQMASTGMVLAMGGGLLIAVAGSLAIQPLARVLGASDDMLRYTCQYLFFILMGAPFKVASLMLNNLLRFQGSAVFAMVGVLLGAVLNIGLDPLFIFVFGMGVSGASLATMTGQVISFIVLVGACRLKGNVPISLRKFCPTVPIMKNIVRGGIPSLCRQSVVSLSTLCLNRVSGSYGDSMIAAMSIVQRLSAFVNSAVVGFGQGFQPVCGVNYGAGNLQRVRKAYFFCMRVNTLMLLVAAVFGFAFAGQVMGVFRVEDEVLRVGAFALRLQCFSLPLWGVISINSMTLQTIGRAVPASLLALARQGLFLLPALFVLTPFLGIWGVQAAQPISDAFTFVLSLFLGWRLLREFGSKKPEVTQGGYSIEE